MRQTSETCARAFRPALLPPKAGDKQQVEPTSAERPQNSTATAMAKRSNDQNNSDPDEDDGETVDLATILAPLSKDQLEMLVAKMVAR
jgi:hypothetical protein